MRPWLCQVLVFGLFLSPFAAAAQQAVPQALTIGAAGAEYLKSVRYHGIETDVVYFDPTGAVPPLETGQTPVPPKAASGPDAQGISPGVNLVFILIVLAILVGLIVLIRGGAGNFTLSFGAEAENPVRQRKGAGHRGLGQATGQMDLQSILMTPDRKRALVLLAQGALMRTVLANGILLQPSWTMRDALRHIPKGQMHMDALRQLVMAGERVLFGDRDVTEAEFQAEVGLIRPLFADART
jgi:hypothetical protein